MQSKTFWIALTVFAWFAATYVGWVGYTASHGAEHHWSGGLPDRPQEFRVIGLAAAKASNAVFGPSEIAYRLPSLLASILIVASVAWLVDWPRTIDWKSQAAMLLACTLPLDAGMRSGMGPPFVAAGLLAVGTVCILKGRSFVPYAGSTLLALGFMTHEITFFYVAIFCFTALAFDWRKYWRPVLATVVISASFFLIESAVYAVLLDDPFARYRACTESASNAPDYNMRFGGSAFRFYAWPLQVLVFCKQWSFALIALLLSGFFAWRRMSVNQKILFVTVFVLWFWLGYGTQVPWAYRPRSRAFHYYFPVMLGIAALLPYTLSLALARRERLAQGIVIVLVCLHLAVLATGGTWGQNVDVSRGLLTYAQQHKNLRFVADAETWNEMRLVNGLEPPENVVNLEALGWSELSADEDSTNALVAEDLLARIDVILLNGERPLQQTETPFRLLCEQHGGDRTRVVPVRYRLLFVPIAYLLGPRGFMIRSHGGEAVKVRKQ